MKPKSAEAPAPGTPRITVRLAEEGLDTIGPHIGEALYRDTAIVAIEPKSIDNGGLPFGKLIDSLGDPYTSGALAFHKKFSTKQRMQAALRLWRLGCIIGVLLGSFFGLISTTLGHFKGGEAFGVFIVSLIIAFVSGCAASFLTAYFDDGDKIIAQERLGMDPPGNEKELIRTRLENNRLTSIVYQPNPEFVETHREKPEKALKIQVGPRPHLENNTNLHAILFWLKLCLEKKGKAATDLDTILNQYFLLQEHVRKQILKINLDSYMDLWTWHYARGHEKEATELELKITEAVYALVETLEPITIAVNELVRILNVPDQQIRDHVAAYDWIKEHVSPEMLRALLARVCQNPLSTKLPDP